MHDLVIRNGIVVDGSGDPPLQADIGIDGDTISEIGKTVKSGKREIDADGHVVSPGFIDGHTHMDAQVFWDPRGESSCWNGVTSAVIGNCGFTLAPSHHHHREMVIRNLERSEDIPRAAMEAGISWGFETFPEFLEVLDLLPKGINYAAQIGHSSLRTWAMGESAFERAASEDELILMKGQLSDALEAGAFGFTTSRLPSHETMDSRPVASRIAEWHEVCELVAVAGQYSAMFELADEIAARSTDPAIKHEYFDRKLELALKTGAKFTFAVVSTNAADDSEWMDQLRFLEESAEAGAQMFGQSHCRGVTIFNSFATQLPFDKLPEWRHLRSLPLADQESELRNPDARDRLVSATQKAVYGQSRGGEARPPDYEQMEVFFNPISGNPTVADIARERHVDPARALIDLALESGMSRYFVQRIGSNDQKVLGAILRHPRTIMTFSDAGAHVSQIVDGGLQAFFLARWVRELEVFRLEEAVRMITRVPALAWGFLDRGLVKEGYIADLNIFDPETIGPKMPTVVNDLPAGAVRLKQESDGILATIVGGIVTISDGQSTEQFPGRLIRHRGSHS